ncbi:MAG: PA0069 family radical SAM protein [Verrucomicrobiales bacterium]|nr:PA0069 family radical SAM protein [Verrucomicrobiales bacterium]
MQKYEAKGRGSVLEPAHRFSNYSVVDDPGVREELARVDPDLEAIRPATKVEIDDSRSILTENRSPDIGFRYSLNPYRGCEHGCAYCYARPYHEYLGYNAGIDFETRILAKELAPDLLEQKLASPSWQPEPIACSGITDCYQPLERNLRITRECLVRFRDFRNPVGVITKNALVTRDLDLLSELSSHEAALVVISLTSLDADLAGRLEPRASRPQARLDAMKALSEAGIPVGVSVAPLIPGLNDHEIPALLEASADHGASFASGTLVRLPYAVKDVFADWLERFLPDRKELILNRIREIRGGELNDSDFHTRMTGKGPLASQIRQLLRLSKRRFGLEERAPILSSSSFRRRLPGQLELF